MSSRLSWKWRLGARKVRHAVVRLLYVDRNPDPARSVIVAGTARSGTTWLGDLLASQMRGRIVFEPFNPHLVPEYAGHSYFQYMRPSDDDEGLFEFTRAVLSGRIRNRWVDREAESLFPRRRIVKEIRACLFLRWIHERFPQVPILFIVRSPFAVVSSRMKLGWATDEDIAPFLGQAKLVEDFLSPWLSIIRNAETEEEKHAVVWCVSTAVPLLQFRDARLPVVFFEDLVLRPHLVLPEILGTLGVEASDFSLKRHARPSTTSRATSAVVEGRDRTESWREDLTDDQVSRIVNVVAGFGLDFLYAEDGRLRGELPPGSIRLGGTGERSETR